MEGLKHRVSFADLQRMPDDGNRYELYDGALRVVPSPLPLHQLIVVRLVEVLLPFSKATGGLLISAPFDIVLSQFDVVQPDLIYFGPESASRIDLHQHVRFAPDLAVEVLSPSTARWDRVQKRDLLERFGLREFWLVDPGEHCIEVSVLKDGRFASPIVMRGGPLESPTLSGLTVNVATLFEGLGPA